MTLTVGSLFSGIGGLDLGLERAGMRVVWQSEIDPYACKVLKKHWPHVPNLGDVTQIDWNSVERPDLVCGGFPCQDISVLGQRAGLEGEHSGLWAHFASAVRHLRPRYVVVENSPSLAVRGLGDVLGDLADCGYDAEWDCVPAASIGAHHLRARLWLLAYPTRERDRLQKDSVQPGWPRPVDCGWWTSEPGLVRVANGVPSRVDRLRGLGNAVVPQVAEWVGRRILEVAA